MSTRYALLVAALVSALAAGCAPRTDNTGSDASVPVSRDAASPDAGLDAPDAMEPADAGAGLDASTGGPDASTPDPDGGVSEAQAFCERQQREYVVKASACNGFAPEAMLIMWRGVRSCEVAGRAAVDGRLVFDPSKADACIDAIHAASCDRLRAGVPECAAALAGKVPSGAICYDTVECVAGTACSASPLICPGTCGALVPAGGDCSGGKTCADGNDCMEDVCYRVPRTGDDCGLSGPYCNVGLYCAGATAQASGKCAPGKTSGPCSPAGDFGDCAAGYDCRADSSGAYTCVQLKPVGAACTVGRKECLQFSYCAPTGVCTVYGTSGDYCQRHASSLQEEAFCLDGNCVQSAASGGTCVGFKAVGETCSRSSDCGMPPMADCDLATHKCVGPCMPQ